MSIADVRNEVALLGAPPIQDEAAGLPCDDGTGYVQSLPIFLHSSFRTGSTWLWRKLRSRSTTFCYYEIFHESLATMTVARATSADHTSWVSRHPPGAPYFLEFLPCITKEGGVAGFDEAMAFDGFIPASGPDGALRNNERAYVERLLDLAWSRRRIPVLSCTRSLGRARALRAAFGGRTIFLHRNLFHQWASYCSLAEDGNRYFTDTIVRSVMGSRHDPFLRSLATRFELDRSQPSAETLFQVFVLLHLYLYSIVYDASDLRLDVTAIATDPAVRAEAERGLADMTGEAIDLSDVREECVFTTFTDASPQRLRDVLEQLAKDIPSASMTPAAAAFVQEALQRGLSEWERFEFFNRRMRSVLTAEIDAAKRALRERDAKIAGLEAEKARLGFALAEAERALDASQADRTPDVEETTVSRGEQEAACRQSDPNGASKTETAPRQPATPAGDEAGPLPKPTQA